MVGCSSTALLQINDRVWDDVHETPWRVNGRRFSAVLLIATLSSSCERICRAIKYLDPTTLILRMHLIRGAANQD